MPVSTYGSFMQPTSPVGEDNRRKMNSYGSVLNNQFQQQQQLPPPPQGQFSFGPNQMYGSPPRNAASLAAIHNPSLALRTFGMGKDSSLPLGRDIFSKFSRPY
jgi:hypothetical protein